MGIEGAGEALEGWARLTLALAVLAVFGVWKLVEIIVWLVSHIHWS